MNTHLQKNIMRRVYYAFAFRVATQPIVAYAVALFALAWWLKELVFVARLWEAFVSRPVGELGSFALEVVRHADALTLVVTAVTVAVAYAFYLQLRKITFYTPVHFAQ